jgi:ATP-dependent Clp protease protease subunit
MKLRLRRGLRFSICSSGGKIAESKEIFAIIRSLSVPVSAEAIDVCESAAVRIFLAADHRVARPNTRFLVHPAHRPVSAGSYSAPELRELAVFLDDADVEEVALLVRRTGYRDRDYLAK